MGQSGDPRGGHQAGKNKLVQVEKVALKTKLRQVKTCRSKNIHSTFFNYLVPSQSFGFANEICQDCAGSSKNIDDRQCYGGYSSLNGQELANEESYC
jgi:hypothetical protein